MQCNYLWQIDTHHHQWGSFHLLSAKDCSSITLTWLGDEVMMWQERLALCVLHTTQLCPKLKILPRRDFDTIFSVCDRNWRTELMIHNQNCGHLAIEQVPIMLTCQPTSITCSIMVSLLPFVIWETESVLLIKLLHMLWIFVWIWISTESVLYIFWTTLAHAAVSFQCYSIWHVTLLM